MTRLVLLILLLTVVYSWEELKYVVVAIWSKIFRQRRTRSNEFEYNDGRNTYEYNKNSELDILVSDIVVIATIPLSLAYLILGSANLPSKLLILLAEYIFLGLALKGIEEYSKRRKFTQDYQGADKLIALVFSLTGLVSPSMNYASGVTRSAGRFGKYLWALALPLVSGLALTIAVRKLGRDEFVARLDPLIAIAILGLVLNATIEVLEKIFRSNKLQMISLMRIVLGIAIIFVLTRV